MSDKLQRSPFIKPARIPARPSVQPVTVRRADLQHAQYASLETFAKEFQLGSSIKHPRGVNITISVDHSLNGAVCERGVVMSDNKKLDTTGHVHIRISPKVAAGLKSGNSNAIEVFKHELAHATQIMVPQPNAPLAKRLFGYLCHEVGADARAGALKPDSGQRAFLQEAGRPGSRFTKLANAIDNAVSDSERKVAIGELEAYMAKLNMPIGGLVPKLLAERDNIARGEQNFVTAASDDYRRELIRDLAEKRSELGSLQSNCKGFGYTADGARRIKSLESSIKLAESHLKNAQQRDATKPRR